MMPLMCTGQLFLFVALPAPRHFSRKASLWRQWPARFQAHNELQFLAAASSTIATSSSVSAYKWYTSAATCWAALASMHHGSGDV